MVDMNASTLAWLSMVWFGFTGAVTASTWISARQRVDSPLAVTVCNLLLSLFPPLNLMVLTLLCVMDRKDRP
jgi:apolipoprotein N-acyltransferase